MEKRRWQKEEMKGGGVNRWEVEEGRGGQTYEELWRGAMDDRDGGWMEKTL